MPNYFGVIHVTVISKFKQLTVSTLTEQPIDPIIKLDTNVVYDPRKCPTFESQRSKSQLNFVQNLS